MTPNKLLFEIRIGKFALIGERVPSDVPLSSKIDYAKGDGWASFAIGRFITLVEWDRL